MKKLATILLLTFLSTGYSQEPIEDFSDITQILVGEEAFDLNDINQNRNCDSEVSFVTLGDGIKSRSYQILRLEESPNGTTAVIRKMTGAGLKGYGTQVSSDNGSSFLIGLGRDKVGTELAKKSSYGGFISWKVELP